MEIHDNVDVTVKATVAAIRKYILISRMTIKLWKKSRYINYNFF